MSTKVVGEGIADLFGSDDMPDLAALASNDPHDRAPAPKAEVDAAGSRKDDQCDRITDLKLRMKEKSETDGEYRQTLKRQVLKPAAMVEKILAKDTVSNIELTVANELMDKVDSGIEDLTYNYPSPQDDDEDDEDDEDDDYDDYDDENAP